MTVVFLTGCVGFYEPTSYDYSASQDKERDEKVRDSVKHYLQSKTPIGFNYEPYEFGELLVEKSEEIKKLDQLIEQKNRLPLKADELGSSYDAKLKELDDKIKAQKEYLKSNNIYPVYKINHIYALENITSDSAMINELDLELYPNYSVKDVHLKMQVALNKARYKTFKYFIRQEPVYESDDWSWQNDKNNTFYSAAFEALNNEQDYKGRLLVTILDMTDYIKQHNDFDENDFAKEQVFIWESENLSTAYRTYQIGKLQNDIDTINSQPIMIGYELTHEVFETNPDSIHKFVYSFDLNYVITRVIESK